MCVRVSMYVRVSKYLCIHKERVFLRFFFFNFFCSFISCRFKSFDFDRNDNFHVYKLFQKLQNGKNSSIFHKKKMVFSLFILLIFVVVVVVLFISIKNHFSYHDTTNGRYVLHTKKNSIHTHFLLFHTGKSFFFARTNFPLK